MTSPKIDDKIDATQLGATHPDWCDPAYCDASAGGADVHHCSTPITWTAQRDDAEFSLARYQYAHSAVGYLLMICNTAIDEHASVLLTDDDLVQLMYARGKLVDLPDSPATPVTG